MITQFEKECPVCGKKVIWTDVRNEPETCGSKMCRTNYAYQKAHITMDGRVRDFKDINVWKGSKGLKDSKKK